MPSISIIIAIYNAANNIQKAMECLYNQTFKDIEIILINDVSKDESKNLCDYYCKIDTKVKVIHKVNEGAGSARN